MRRLYSGLWWLALPWVVLRLYWRSLRAPDYRKRIAERFGLAPFRLARPSIWLHAVSVGETQAAQRLIRELRERWPECELVVTTTTPTGSRRVRELFGDSVHHAYLPFDLGPFIRCFLERARPVLTILMETEIWPNLIDRCARAGIPVALANARLSTRSARGYRRLGGFTREVFSRLDLIAAQHRDDAERFIALGARPQAVRVTGSVKFDFRLPASLREQAEAMRRGWNAAAGEGRMVWVAASTHAGEDEVVLAAHRRILAAVPNALLILVPRHPERFEPVAQLIGQQGFVFQRRSAGGAVTAGTQAYLGDTMGELPLLIAASDAVFVGGSLIERGGHNVLEPAALGVPVCFGPHMFNFEVISRMLLDADAAAVVHNRDELAATITTWLTDASIRARIGENARRAVERNRGALEALLTLLNASIDCRRDNRAASNERKNPP